MKHTKSIRNSLYNCLFVNFPSLNREEFIKERYNLFPGEDLYIDFLKTDNHQIRIENSKKILLRLVYHHNFSVPSEFLFNLIEMQTEDHPSFITEGDYIAQDHFVHLVNLYLLGIYIFSTHNSLQSQCIKQINRLKRKVQIRNSNFVQKISVYRLFSSMWAYFVIFHDIAYPLERIKPKDRSKEKNKALFKPFKKVEDLTIYDISLKILSKIITIKSIIDNEDSNSFKELFLEFHSNFKVKIHGKTVFSFTKGSPPKNEEELELYYKYNSLIESWGNSIFIPSIEGVRSLKIILSFFPKSNIGALLERTDYGQPLVFVSYNDKEVIYFDGYEEEKFLGKKKLNFWVSAFRGDILKKPYLSWNYFILEPNIFFDEVVPELFSDNKPYLDNLIEYFDKDEEFRRLKRLEVDSADDLAFFCFYKLLTLMRYQKFRDKDQNLERCEMVIEETIQKVCDDIPNVASIIIKDFFKGRMKGNLEKKEIDQNKSCTFSPHSFCNEHDIDGLASYVINEIITNKKSIVDELKHTFDKTIKNPLSFINSVNSITKYTTKAFSDLIKEIDAQQPDIKNFYYPFNNADFKKDFDLTKIIEDDCPHLNPLYVFFKDYLAASDLKPFIKNYQPNWTKNPKYEFADGGFIDHGFAASLLLLSTQSINKKMIEYLDTNYSERRKIDPMIRKLLLSYFITSDEDLSFSKIILGLIEEKILDSIFMHNFYPEDAPDDFSDLKDYRVNRNTDPFSYIAYLSDGIQKWDRMRFANQARIDLKNIVPGSSYDVRIVGNLINIYIYIYSIDEEAEGKNLRNELGKYLRGIKSFINIKSI